MDFLSFINVMGSMLFLFLLEMVVLGVRGWKTSRQTPMSHFVYTVILQSRDSSFCKVFWVTGLWYLFIIPLLSGLLGLMLLSLFLGLPFNSGSPVILGTVFNIFGIVIGLIFIFFMLEYKDYFDNISSKVPKSVVEKGNTFIVKPSRKLKDSIATVYGVVKGKFCPVITSEE